MKISYNWLKDYIDIKLSPERLADLIAMRAFEVDEVLRLKGLENILVGEILEIKKHPRADKLFVAQIDIGKKKIQTIFGTQFKLKVGQKVPVMVAPAKLPTGIKVDRVKLRGIESEGMICSDKELGIVESELGLTFFEEEKVGTSVTKALALDAVLDLAVPTNRPDCLGHVGVAREISAMLGKELKVKKYKLKSDGVKTELPLKVQIKDKKLCSRYSALIISGIKIKESPPLIKNRLRSVGIRPINNVVDLTNYMMMDYGQPLHAFDYDKVQGHEMIIRKAKDKEKIITLDGIKRELKKDMLIIQDKKRLIDLAGIMGGAKSMISDKTSTIILQAANFDPINIRRTSQALALRTDAAVIYEKGPDLNLTLPTLAKTFFLLKKQNPEAKIEKIINLQNKKIKPQKINLELDRVESLLGMKIRDSQIIKILKSLGFRVKKYQKRLEVLIPTFRQDVTWDQDLIEEIARIYGFEKIPEVMPKAELLPPAENKSLFWERIAKDTLCGAGFTEVYNYSFIGKDLIQKLDLEVKDHIKLKNPLSRDREYLRNSLIPSMLITVKGNLKNFERVRLFELARVYLSKTKEVLPEEKKRLCGAVANQQPTTNNQQLFYETKGAVELLLDKLGIPRQVTSYKLQVTSPIWHPGRSAEIKVNGQIIGIIGEIHPKVLHRLDIETRVALFDLDFEKLVNFAFLKKAYQKISKYPSVTLDLAFILAKKVLSSEVKNVILKEGRPLVKDVELFDVYFGKPLKKDEKSLAFHITYQAEDRTLKDEEVKVVQDKIIKALKEKFAAEIREK